jgi:hypothetical protein
MIHPNDPPPRVKYEIRVLFKSNEAPWSGGYDPSPYGPKNDGEAVEWAVRMQEGLGNDYAVTLTRDGQVMPLPSEPIDATLTAGK